MDYSKVPNDDLLDVIEMTAKLEKHMSQILHNAEIPLAMSSIMNATIHCIMSQCNTLDEVLHYRKIFMDFFDASIKSIRLKND